MLLFLDLLQKSGESNSEKEGNIRDYADIRQLICLSNLESLNAELIRDGLSQKKDYLSSIYCNIPNESINQV